MDFLFHKVIFFELYWAFSFNVDEFIDVFVWQLC